MADRTKVIRFVVKPVVFLAALVPAVYLTWAALTNHLSANPLSDVTNETGVWTLRFLCITLLLTPLRRVARLNLVSPFRRMMGLYAFFYGTLHFLTYLILDRFAGLVDFPGGIVSFTTVKRVILSSIGDIAMRPFITVGFFAFLTMVPLALTSTAGWIRRLGGKRWAALHRLVYLTGIAGVVHYWWLVKADVQRPMIYGTIVAVLLGTRLYYRFRRATVRRSASPSASGLDRQSARG
jgi:methionine sulfoxide reductase heme-binding subunit